MIKPTNKITGKLNASIIHVYPELENIEITPTVEDQTYTPTKYGFEEVKVKGVQAYIDEDIKPEYIKDGVDILGVIGNVIELQGEEKTISPSTTQQIIVPSDGKNGITRLTVEAVDSSIDENIKPENIKEGTNILGIAGQYRGIDTSDATATEEDITEGKTAYVNGEKITGTSTKTDTTDATATAGDILTGKTAYVNGVKIEGTLIPAEDLQEQLDAQDAVIQELQNEVADKTRGKYNIRIDMNAEVPNMQIVKFITEIADGIIDVGEFTSTKDMFGYFINLKSVPFFDTSNVTDMSNMFNHCKRLTTIPLFDTSKVTNMSGMFSHTTGLKEVPLLDTSSVTNMKNMFNHCETITELPLLNTSSLQMAEALFGGCYLLENLPEIDLSKATNTKSMCWDATSITSVPNYDISKSTITQFMFRNCTNLIDVPAFNLANVTNMQGMFMDCSSLSDESLNNILAMCITAVKITNSTYKKLSYIGLTSDQATRCQSLSNYEAFTAAGWRTGY